MDGVNNLPLRKLPRFDHPDKREQYQERATYTGQAAAILGTGWVLDEIHTNVWVLATFYCYFYALFLCTILVYSSTEEKRLLLKVVAGGGLRFGCQHPGSFEAGGTQNNRHHEERTLIIILLYESYVHTGTRKGHEVYVYKYQISLFNTFGE